MRSATARCLDHAPAEWAALLAADPGALPSHRPELWSAFTAVLPAHSLRVLVAEQDGATLGGVPVLVQRRGGLCWLQALPRTLPAPPLALPGRHAEVDLLLARAVADLAREHAALGGAWSCYRPAGPAVDPAALALVPGETRLLDAALVDLAGGLDAALARVDRKQRQAFHHPRVRTLEFTQDPAYLEEAYALHLAQGREWSGHRALPLEFARRLLGAGGASPVARLFSLVDARGVLSATFALDGPHETFLWWSGTHREGRRRGAFPLLAWRVVEWAAAAGRARVNLGASTGLARVAAFKHGLGTTAMPYPVRWLSARHAPPAGRAVAWLQALVRRGRARGEAA